MKPVFLFGVLLLGGGVGFAVARGKDFVRAGTVGVSGFLVCLLAVLRLEADDSAGRPAALQSAAASGDMLAKVTEGVGFGTAVGGLGVGFLIGVLLVQWVA